MSSVANAYFSTISDNIAVSVRRQWENDITAAEEKRSDDPSVMDILGANDVSGSQSASNASAHVAGTRLEEAIDLALTIEQKQ
jgi:hypothetical protein